MEIIISDKLQNYLNVTLKNYMKYSETFKITPKKDNYQILSDHESELIKLLKDDILKESLINSIYTSLVRIDSEVKDVQLNVINPKELSLTVYYIKSGKREMKHIGILPYSFNKEVLFLLGKEHPEKGWHDALKWSDFGGSPELKDMSIYEVAAREGYEESMGFLGSYEELLDKVKKTDDVFYYNKALLFLIEIPYNEGLPKLYQNVYDYNSKCMVINDKGFGIVPSCPHGYFEKIQVEWMSSNFINNNKSILRNKFYSFFKEVIDSKIK